MSVFPETLYTMVYCIQSWWKQVMFPLMEADFKLI